MFSNKKLILVLSFLIAFTVISQFSRGAQFCGSGTDCWQACEDYCTYGCEQATSSLNCDSQYCSYDCKPAPKPDYCSSSVSSSNCNIISFTVDFNNGGYCNNPQNCPAKIKVLDSETQNPIKNAKVNWNGGTLYTNSNGRVGFTVDIGSSQDVHVSKSGYNSGSTHIHCQSCGNTIRKTVYLDKKEPKQCNLEIVNNEITLSKSEICMGKSDSLTLNNYLDVIKKPSNCQGTPDSSVRIKVYGRCQYYYDWEQIETFSTNVYGSGSFPSSKSLTNNDFKKISGWKDCKYFRIKTKAEFANVDICKNYDCQGISNILKVNPRECENCHIIFKHLDISGNNIDTKIKNTGSKGTNIDLNFYVDSGKISTKHIYLNPGKSKRVSKYYSFSSGQHHINVKAIANCGDSDSISTTIGRKDNKGDLKIIAAECPGDCSDGDRIGNARVEIGGPEHESGYTDSDGKIYFNNVKSRTYNVEVSKSDYFPETREVYVTENSLTTQKICLDKCEEGEEVIIEDVNVDPSDICVDRDENVDISADISLDSGEDRKVTARFYIKDDSGWDYIGKERRYMDSDDIKEFEVTYHYNAGDLDEGEHRIKVVTENGDYDAEYTYLDVSECDRCSFDIVDSTFPNKVRRGSIFNIFLKLRMNKNFHEDTNANVDVYFKPSEESKNKKFNFNWDGDKDKKTFSFDTNNWDKGWHDVYVSAFEKESRCHIRKKIGSIKIKEGGERCDVSIKRFYYPSHLYTDERATFIPVIENTGTNRAKMKTYLYIDGNLEKKWTDYLDPGQDKSMRYLTGLSRGTHDVKLKVVPCGDFDKAVIRTETVRVSNVSDGENEEDGDQVPEDLGTEVEFGPNELTTGFCQGTVTTIDIKSSQLQEFNISVNGINEKWVDYTKNVKVSGKKRVYIYISPKALGDYEFTIKVNNIEREYKQDMTLHVAPVEEVKERDWPSVSGAINSLKTSVWGVLLLIIALIFVIYAGRKGMLENKEEIYSPTVYSERSPELYSPDRY